MKGLLHPLHWLSHNSTRKLTDFLYVFSLMFIVMNKCNHRAMSTNGCIMDSCAVSSEYNDVSGALVAVGGSRCCCVHSPAHYSS